MGAHAAKNHEDRLDKHSIDENNLWLECHPVAPIVISSMLDMRNFQYSPLHSVLCSLPPSLTFLSLSSLPYMMRGKFLQKMLISHEEEVKSSKYTQFFFYSGCCAFAADRSLQSSNRSILSSHSLF